MESPTILFFMVCFVVLFFVVGIIAGWFINDIVYNFYNKNNTHQLHPEMYDDNGIFINEELLSVRFIDEEEEEEEEDDYH
jgi:hypothetical protein